MAKIEIDNKKMWESLIWKVGEPLRQHIEKALSEQGLTVTDKGEIVSIEPEQFRPKLGRWYYCFKSWHNREMYHNGGIYKAVINTHFDDVALLSDDGNSYPWDCKEVFEQYFRPATEEEILKAKYGITGIGSKKAEGKLGEMISQRMVSAEAKEALLPDGEFTDFQKVLAELISIAQQSCLTPLQLAVLHSETLILEARKQIVSEIDVDAMVEDFINNLPAYTVIHETVDKRLWGEPFKKGIEDTLNKIEKG